jgi:hypothetical protein
MNEKQIEKLAELGNEWIKGDMHRIYFDDLAGWYGLKTKLYNSGNINSATFRGDEISNTEAREIENKFLGKKVYFDVNANKFGSTGFEKLPKSLAYIVEKITAAVS